MMDKEIYRVRKIGRTVFYARCNISDTKQFNWSDTGIEYEEFVRKISWVKLANPLSLYTTDNVREELEQDTGMWLDIEELEPILDQQKYKKIIKDHV